MVTICAGRKKHIRRSASLKTLEKYGVEILKGERPIIEIGQGIYLVPPRSADPQSESPDEEYEEHEVRYETASGRADARTIWPGTQTAAIPAPCA